MGKDEVIGSIGCAAVGLGALALGIVTSPIWIPIATYRYLRYEKKSPHNINIPRKLRNVGQYMFPGEARIEINKDHSEPLPSYQVRCVSWKENRMLAAAYTEILDSEMVPDPLRIGGIKEIKMYGTSVVFPGIKNQNGKPKTINVKQDNGSAHRAALAIAIKIGDYSGLPVEDHSTDELGNLEKKL